MQQRRVKVTLFGPAVKQGRWSVTSKNTGSFGRGEIYIEVVDGPQFTTEEMLELYNALKSHSDFESIGDVSTGNELAGSFPAIAITWQPKLRRAKDHERFMGEVVQILKGFGTLNIVLPVVSQ